MPKLGSALLLLTAGFELQPELQPKTTQHQSTHRPARILDSNPNEALPLTTSPRARPVPRQHSPNAAESLNRHSPPCTQTVEHLYQLFHPPPAQ
jgi:hypothetical protein